MMEREFNIEQREVSSHLPTMIFIIFRLFDALPNFPVTTGETMGDYYLSTWYILVA